MEKVNLVSVLKSASSVMNLFRIACKQKRKKVRYNNNTAAAAAFTKNATGK